MRVDHIRCLLVVDIVEGVASVPGCNQANLNKSEENIIQNTQDENEDAASNNEQPTHKKHSITHQLEVRRATRLATHLERRERSVVGVVAGEIDVCG